MKFGCSFRVAALLTGLSISPVRLGRITASYNEAISGVLTSKVFVREQANHKEFSGLTSTLASAKVRNMTYASIYLPMVVTLASLAIGLTLVFGGIEVLGGAITVGTLVAFMGFANNIFCLLYTSPSPRDLSTSRMPSSA